MFGKKDDWRGESTDAKYLSKEYLQMLIDELDSKISNFSKLREVYQKELMERENLENCMRSNKGIENQIRADAISA